MLENTSVVKRDHSIFIRLSLCISFSCMMLFAQPALSQLDPRLLTVHERVAVVEKDLVQIGKALGSRDPGRQLLTELKSSCERTSGYLSHATDVLWLYNGMSSQTDRNNLRGYTDKSLKQLIKFLTMEEEKTNDAIALTSKPGIVNKATELKNLIRESIDILNQNVKKLYE